MGISRGAPYIYFLNIKGRNISILQGLRPKIMKRNSYNRLLNQRIISSHVTVV
jgi:hypothetical protein